MMLQATVMGPAISPGQLYHSRNQAGPSRHGHHHLFTTASDKPPPLGRTVTSLSRDVDGADLTVEEELVWFDSTVLWSRGAEIHRKYTFDHEGEEVSRAVFVWFNTGDPASSSTYASESRSTKQPSSTFGPFHQSQYSSWGGPRTSSSSSSSKTSGLQRTLVVFLQTRAHVYFPSGDDIIVHLPFQIDNAWPLRDGGVLLQRVLDKRELRRLGKGKQRNGSMLKGMEQSSMSILDDLVDLDEEGAPDLPRLFTLQSPFEEMRMVVEGLVEGGYDVKEGRLDPATQPLEAATTILHVTEDPYPFVVALDRETGEIVIYRQTRITPKAEPPPPTPRTMRPEELLRQPDPAIPPKPSRPSLHRNPSSFATHADRRLSGAADPLDRTQRRAPRQSRGADRQSLLSNTGDLQAALDPTPFQPAQIKTRARGVSTASVISVEGNRRVSAASALMRQDIVEPPRRMSGKVTARQDFRETTMIMGLEREEIGLRSDVVLDRVWVWKPPSQTDPKYIHVFLTDDLTTSLVNINIHIATPSDPQLYVFKAHLSTGTTTSWLVTPLHSIPCASAVPVISTRHGIHDTLVLSADGTLVLVTSNGRQIPLNLPGRRDDGRDDVARKLASSLNMALDEDHVMGHQHHVAKITALVDAHSSNFTAVLEDGERVLVSADFRIRDPLVRRCLEAIAFAISEADFFVVKQELLARLEALSGPERRDRQAVWGAVAETITTMLGIPSFRNESAPLEAIVTDAAESADPVTRKLATKVRGMRLTSNKGRTSNLSRPICGSSLPTSTGAPILLVLHLVAQDCRLSATGQAGLVYLVPLLLKISRGIGRLDWADYWMRLMPMSVTITSTDGLPSRKIDTSILDQFDTPPDVLLYLSRRLATVTRLFPQPHSIYPHSTMTVLGSPRPCDHTAKLCEIYDAFCITHSSHVGLTASEALIARASNAVLLMVERGLNAEWVADLPHSVSLLILEIIRICQNSPSKNWDESVYAFIGRTDLANQASGKITMAMQPPLPTLDVEEAPSIGGLVSTVTDSSEKGKGYLPAVPHVRFGADRRVQEVERIMQTTKARTIAVQEPKNTSEQDIVQYHQSVVNTIANRTLAIPVGQGIFEYGTRAMTITDTWEIPVIELSVKISPGNAVLQAQVIAENVDWPCFHNGVASALSISPDCKGIDSSWIILNRPASLNPEHGGFLLGLGLTGHLRSLMTYHAFPYMEPRHDFTSVGLLLGLACSYAGSEDLLVTKVLSLHTHALLPLGSMELNAAPIIQSAALVGLGLMYAGSRNLRMAEVALFEVGRKEMMGVDSFSDSQEAYSFSASMAFALIMLGRGEQTTSEVDRRMLAQLRRCIIGDNASLDTGRKASNTASIDATITSPGATLALGLMYLKTGRRDIADILEIPLSAFAMELVRPDLLLLRTYARALIMWDDISPTLAWIEAQLPAFIQSQHKGHKRTSAMELNTELAYINIIAGACFAIGIKYAGTATEVAHNNLMSFFGVLGKIAAGQSMTYEGRIRRTAARQGMNMVTIALAVVMSGTGELNVLRRLRVSHGQEGAGVNYGTHMAMHMACGILFLGRGHYTLGNSNLAIAAMSIAFFPRFLASPGDNKAYPQAFRHLWALAVEPRCLMARDADTQETVYMPVKVKLNEGEKVRQQSLISPTLIAPFESLMSIEVDSPRYWPIIYDLSNPRDEETLVRTRTIHVKRKAGFLDYNTDPRGNRSIFVRAGSMNGFDLHFDLVSAATPPSIPAEEVTALIKAHSGHAGLISLAQRFGDDTAFDVFVRTILLECVSLDKVSVISVYLSMYLGSKRQAELLLDEMNHLAFLRRYYNARIFEKNYSTTTASGERRFALIRPSFLAASQRQLTGGILEPSDDVLRSYHQSHSWPQEDIQLAAYLTRNEVPPLAFLGALRNRLRGERVEDLQALLLKVRDAVGRYSEAVNATFDMQGGDEVGTDGRVWKADSMEAAVKIWLER